MAHVEETRKLLEEKLEATGELGKIKAAVMAAGLQALTAEAEAEQSSIFYTSIALKEAKQRNLDAFKVVADWLSDLGLSYTLNVMMLEASLKKQDVAAVDRDALLHSLQKNGGASGISSAHAILPQLLVASGAATASPVLPVVASTAAVATTASTMSKASPTAASSAATATGAPSALSVPPASTSSSSVPTPLAVAVAPKPASKFTFTKKPEDTKFFIANIEDKSFYRFNEVDGQQVNIDGLKRCKIFILDAIDSMQVDFCEDCELYVSACEGSIFIRDSKNITCHVACKQLRTRDSHHLKVHLFAGTDPVVESSTDVHFYPYNLRAPALIDKFKKSRLDPKCNRFVHVYDFTPNTAGTPNWTVHYPDHGVSMISVAAHLGAPEAPAEIELLLNGQLAPGASSESGANKSLDIKSGATSWTGGAAAAAPQSSAKPPTPTMASKVPPIAGMAGLAAVASSTAAATISKPPAAAATAALSSMRPADDSDEDKFEDYDEDDDDDAGPEKKESDDDDDTF